MQITFDPNNKKDLEEAHKVMALLQDDTWPVVDGKKAAEAISESATKEVDKPATKKAPAKPKAEPEPKEEPAKAITKADLVTAMKPLMTDKTKRDAIKDLFTEFGAETLGGVAENDYAELLEKVNGLAK